MLFPTYYYVNVRTHNSCKMTPNHGRTRYYTYLVTGMRVRLDYEKYPIGGYVAVLSRVSSAIVKCSNGVIIIIKLQMNEFERESREKKQGRGKKEESVDGGGSRAYAYAMHA